MREGKSFPARSDGGRRRRSPLPATSSTRHRSGLSWPCDLRGSAGPAFRDERLQTLKEFFRYPQGVGGIPGGELDELLLVRLLPGVEDTVKHAGVFPPHLAGVDDRPVEYGNDTRRQTGSLGRSYPQALLGYRFDDGR